MTRLVIVGAGGFGREMLGWVLDGATYAPHIDVDDIVFLDRDRQQLARHGLDYTIIGDPENYAPQAGDYLMCAIGDPHTKLRLCRALMAKGAQFVSVMHKSAIIGMNSTIGTGCIMCPNTVITTNVKLGKFVTLNVSSTVGHDAIVGDGCTLSGHADVTGAVTLGEGVFMGTHAAILPSAVVGDDAIIGAGSVVLRKVPPSTTVVGVPARKTARVKGKRP